jgi:putative membrane protein
LVPIFAGAGIAFVVLSRIFEYLLAVHPIPTNFAFCGLIAGSLPFIFQKVKGHPVTVGKTIPFLVFFAIVIAMALMGEASGTAADVSFSIVNVVKLFGVGIVAAATMVVPGVSGSMMLMLLGYYDVILATINDAIDALLAFDMGEIFRVVGVLAPFGIGVLLGIFAIAKIIEFIFSKAEIHAYYAIIGLIMASPIAILLQTDWSKFSIVTMLISVVTFAAGWFTASKLGGE